MYVRTCPLRRSNQYCTATVEYRTGSTVHTGSRVQYQYVQDGHARLYHMYQYVEQQRSGREYTVLRSTVPVVPVVR